MKKNYTKYIKLDYNFLHLPEVCATIEKFKSEGLTTVVLVLERLLYRTHTIGMFDNLGNIHTKVGVQKRTLVKLISSIPVFRVDEKNGLFWAPRLRKKLGLPADPTEEETEYIVKNGNIYYGSAEKNADDEMISQNKMKSISNHSSKPCSQLTDNQKKQHCNKDNNISNKNKEISSNNANTKQVSLCAADAADEKEFKEILSSTHWCKSVSKRMGIDLSDDHTMSKFAEWMYAYCATNEKKIRDSSELRKYAANLLRNGTNTRAEIDKFMDEHESEKSASNVEEHEKPSEYELVYNKIRFSASGNRLPDWAPQQPSLDVAFSYIQGKWIPYEQFDQEKEKGVLEYKEKNEPEYFEMTGGNK